MQTGDLITKKSQYSESRSKKLKLANKKTPALLYINKLGKTSY